MAATSVLFKGALTGPSPVDRARTGSKHHLLTDATGIPLAITLTGGHRNDVTQLLALVDGVGPVRAKIGRPRRRAERVVADRGSDHDKDRREPRRRGGTPVIARRGAEHGSGIGRQRWGRRAELRPAAQFVPSAHALRARRRTAPGVHAARLRRRLPAAPAPGPRLTAPHRGRRPTHARTGRGSTPTPRSPPAAWAADPRPIPHADRACRPNTRQRCSQRSPKSKTNRNSSPGFTAARSSTSSSSSNGSGSTKPIRRPSPSSNSCRCDRSHRANAVLIASASAANVWDGPTMKIRPGAGRNRAPRPPRRSTRT
jgi:Transposase DDE domain